MAVLKIVLSWARGIRRSINSKTLSDSDLLYLARKSAQEEKAKTLFTIQVIREVDRRGIYLRLGFGSLHEYVIKELGFEGSAADRRIAAARLTREIPDLEGKIADGRIGLTNVVQARTFFKREERLQNRKLSAQDKWEVLTQLEGKTTREAQKTLLSISPEQVVFQESQRMVTPEFAEIKMIIPEVLHAKLETLKSLLSHRIPGGTYVELIEAIADIALQKLDKARGAAQETPAPVFREGHASKIEDVSKIEKASKLEDASRIENVLPGDDTSMKNELPRANQKTSTGQANRTRYVAAGVVKQIWQRAQSRCEYVDEKTGRRCESRFRLEIHHDTPYAKNGDSSFSNLKLFCKNHNSHMAVRDYGRTKMQLYLPHLRE